MLIKIFLLIQSKGNIFKKSIFFYNQQILFNVLLKIFFLYRCQELVHKTQQYYSKK